MGAQAVVGWMVCVAMLGGAVACHNLDPMTDPVTVSPVDFRLDGPGENVDAYARMVDVRSGLTFAGTTPTKRRPRCAQASARAIAGSRPA
jgi:hypothetical protein